jgi:hypothetical protein
MGKLSEFDPELLALFRGEAAAEVEAAVLAGTLANTPPPRISESEQKAALVAEIMGRGNPYATGSLTDALRLEVLDAKQAAALRAEAGVTNSADRQAAEATRRAAFETTLHHSHAKTHTPSRACRE